MRSITLGPGESLVLRDSTRIFAECTIEDAYVDHLTTQELARRLGVDTSVIRSIRENDWDSIREGEHFVVLRKDDLREYKRLWGRSVSRQATHLALWTPKGIALISEIVGEGVGRYIGAPVASTREAMAKSAFLANRTRTRFRELNELRNQVQGQSSAKEFMGRWGYWLMMRAQLMIDVPTWWGAYEKALANGRTEDTAVALADQAVKDTQGGGEEVDQAGIERGGPYHKLFTAFYSYMGSTLNNMYATTKVDSKGKATANILLMVMVPTVLQSLLKHAMTPGGDDWDKWLKSLPVEIISFMAGLMVFVRELDPFVKAMAGEGGMGYGGSAGLRMIGDIARFGQQAGQREFDMAIGKAFINLLGDLTGLPSVQANRTLTGLDALTSGKTSNPAALLMEVSR